MTINNNGLKGLIKLGLFLMIGVSMSACSATWKEEALQNDGSTIMVTRSQTHGGRHEIGSVPPIEEQSISFMLPHSDKVITWKDEATEDVGHANFDIVALHVLNGTPLLVTIPDLCPAYNKWGRPNPPYVFFKYVGNTWQRIPLSDFPSELKSINLALDTLEWKDEKRLVSLSPVAAGMVKQFNSGIKLPEYQTILRTPGVYSETGCMDFNSPQMMSPKAPLPIKTPTDPQKHQ